METTIQKTVEAIKELIIINNDRREGYKKAAEEVKEADLKELFTKLSIQSEKFSTELKDLLPEETDTPKEDETKTTGKIYRVWMDIKNAIASNNRKAVLASCEFGEDIAKKTYEDVLNNTDEFSSDILNTIRQQKTKILEEHNKIKLLRDRA